MNPPFQLPILIPLALLVFTVAVLGSWRGASGLPTGRRMLLLTLRAAAMGIALAILFNPGKWVRPPDETTRPWLLLTDVSSSMKQPAGEGLTRAEQAAVLIRDAAASAKSADTLLRIQPFSESLAGEFPPHEPPPADGPSTRLTAALSQALQDSGASGESLAGIVVFSDGRETSTSTRTALDELALRARSRNTAIHTVAIGADVPSPDLALLQNRASFTAFAGQPLKIPFALESSGLDPLRATVTLKDEAGTEIATLRPELSPGKTVTAAFETRAPEQTTRWTIETPLIPGEARRANNQTSFQIRVIDSKTRVFLAEGAPYWDSKFLAQLLRQQPHMDVHSVHRLSDQRYFRINSGSEDPAETDHAVFPATLAEFARYDLIVFGKNVDPFLTGDRAEALRAYVRDQGGAVLFARGKPATSEIPALEVLEPVVWAASTAGEFRFQPTRDGEAAGLFGQALPAPDASLWATLPPLQDGRQITLVKPFTRVLAEGIPATGGPSGAFPALLVRRYGQGVTGLVNADGLWKWDFYPEARELGNCYEDFWTQLIQWMASYSEFLPGQDFSLRLPSSRGESGTPVPVTLSFRGKADADPAPLLIVTPPDGKESRIQPAAVPDPSGRPLWRASFTPDTPGDWKLSVHDPRPDAPPTPETTFTVPRSPEEDDDLSPDPDYLAAISQATGGEAIAPADFPAFLNRHFHSEPPATRESGAVWKPLWNQAPLALLIATLLTGEWFLRRRQGLS